MAGVLRLTWAEFDRAVIVLSRVIRGNPEPNAPATIYGVPRGGLPLAVALSHMTGLPLVTAPRPDSWIIDDIADTGATLMAYQNRKAVWVRRSRCLVSVPAAYQLNDDRWVLFPWEQETNINGDRATYAGR